MCIILPILLIVTVFMVYASYSIRSGIYIKALCRNKKKDRVVALTFDDGPHSEQTPKLLDILKQQNIQVCFFCIGRQIEGNEEILRRMKDEGHLIGNHSFNHSFSFTLSGSHKVKQELQSCEDEIANVINERPLLFRPPFGVTNPLIAKVVKAMGYITIGWSVRSMDTKSEALAMKRIKRYLKPGSVILLHDHLSYSDSLLINILAYLKKERYTIERVDRLFDIEKTTR